MNAVTSNCVPVKKKRKSALAQLIAIHMRDGATTINQLMDLTGYSRRAIFEAKNELDESAAECTDSAAECTVQPSALTVQPSALTVQPSALSSAAECTPEAPDASRAPTRARLDNINNININNIYNNTNTGVAASTSRAREAAGAEQPLAPAPSPISENIDQLVKKSPKSIFNRDQLVYQLHQFVEDRQMAEKTIDMLLERYDLDVMSGAMIRLRLKDDEEEIKSYTRMLNLLAEDVARDHARGIRRDSLGWGAKVLPNGRVLCQWG